MNKNFKDLISDLQEAFAPVFEEQKRLKEIHCPPLFKTLEEMEVTISSIGGNCPVQAEGTFDGKVFYFRARGEHWSFTVAGDQESIWGEHAWHTEGAYGEELFAAGWMDEHEALEFIIRSVNLYRAAHAFDK